MAEVNNVITMGIGEPGTIEHFTLMGLSATTPAVGGGGHGRTMMVGIGCLLLLLL